MDEGPLGFYAEQLDPLSHGDTTFDGLRDMRQCDFRDEHNISFSLSKKLVFTTNYQSSNGLTIYTNAFMKPVHHTSSCQLAHLSRSDPRYLQQKMHRRDLRRNIDSQLTINALAKASGNRWSESTQGLIHIRIREFNIHHNIMWIVLTSIAITGAVHRITYL